jgi:hypothetical protein
LICYIFFFFGLDKGRTGRLGRKATLAVREEMAEMDQDPKQSDALSSPEKSALLKSRGDAVASADNT